MEYTDRFIYTNILDALKISPIVFLNGARQAGKSTLVQNMRHKIGVKGKPAEYVSFDRQVFMASATAAPETFLTNYENTLIIDEVQRVPELIPSLKAVVDELRLEDKAHANGRYVLTGSASIMALPKLSDYLVGRMTVLTLYPFCTSEVLKGKGDGLQRLFNLNFNNLKDHKIRLIDAIKRSTFPEISSKTIQEQNLWFDGYLTTILQRDVRMLADLEKISVLPHLLRVLATRAGSLINDSDIAREIGFNSVTTKFYRNILKMLFLNFSVPPWHRNIGKRLVKSAKGYLTDTMMLCYMLDLNIEDIQTKKPELFGHLLENYIATELMKQLSFNSIKAQLFHFRTSDGKEVDFVLEKPDGSILAIEVKKSESVKIHDFKGIKLLEDKIKEDFIGGIILYAGKEAVPFGKNLWAVPYSILWQ